MRAARRAAPTTRRAWTARLLARTCSSIKEAAAPPARRTPPQPKRLRVQPGFNLNDRKDACEAVANTNCAQELQNAGCKTCGPNDQTCLDCKTPGENVQLDKRSCGPTCPQNSSPNQNVCECNPGFNLNDRKDACEAVANTNCAQELQNAGCKTCGPTTRRAWTARSWRERAAR
ncbi:High cysteine protein [Giardia duodenalis]|uniref:High cysteine protein n=1 Tax=Giardia intestinalis (strain ATCC 50803 / WB clone C6) TaxID=184922 RepID=A0A644EYM0_GIAIC|nr:High cysteine protein [Giardia intestinalis]KAE8301200.1 High cysteine protein [Giardia intestinalis]